MSDKEVIEYLGKKAPLIEWKIEGNRIRGSALIYKKIISDTVPTGRTHMILDVIAEAFMEDYKRKKK